MRKRTPKIIYLKASISLLSNFFLEDCAACDFEKELSSNEQLAKATPEIQNKAKHDITKRTIERRNLLRKKLSFSFITIVSAIITGVLFVLLLRYISLTNIFLINHYFAVLSIICFSWATLGRLGWQGQSIKGDTVFEDLDGFIFWLLYWLGAFFGLLAVD